MALQIASPLDFEVKPEEVQLPSQRDTDKAVLMRRPDPIALISGNGDVPDVLTGVMLASLKGKREEIELTAETFPQIMKSMDVIAIATLVEPKLWTGDEMSADGRMPVKWLSFEDKGFIFAYALGAEYQPAESFRPEQNGSVPVVQPRNGFRPDPKRRARSKK